MVRTVKHAIQALALWALLAGAAQAQSLVERFRGHIEAAGQLDRDNDYAGAMEQMRAALALLPPTSAETARVEFDTTLILVKILVQEADWAEVLALTDNLLAMADGFGPVLPADLGRLHEFRGQALLHMGQRAAARAVFDAGLERHAPDGATAAQLAMGKARAFLAERDVAGLSVHLETWAPRLETGPTAFDFALIRARWALQSGEFDTARDILTGLWQTANDPVLQAEASYALGELALVTGDLATAELRFLEAQAQFQAAFGADHQTTGLLTHARALIRAEIGDVEQSLRLFAMAQVQLAEALSPQHPTTISTVTERVAPLLRAGRVDEAIAMAEAALNAYREAGLSGAYEYRLALSALGLSRAAAGQHDAARDILSQTAFDGPGGLVAPDRPPGLIALSRIALAEGDAAGAESLLTEAIALLERFPGYGIDKLGEANRLRAEALIALGRTAEAETLIQRNFDAVARVILERPTAPVAAAKVQPLSMRPILEQVIAHRWQHYEATGNAAPLFEAMQLLHLDELGLASAGLTFGTSMREEDRGLMTALAETSRRIGALERRLNLPARAGDAVDRQALLDELIGLTREYAAQLRDAQVRGLGTRRLVAPETLADTLGGDEGFWIHAALPDSGYAVFLTADGATTAVRLPGLDALRPVIARLRASVQLLPSGDALPEFDMAAAVEAYTAAFGPLQEKLAAVDRLILMPDGPLRQISLSIFAAGPRGDGDSHTWLGASHTLAVAPSVDAFVELRRSAAGADESFAKSILGFADPVLASNADWDPAQSLWDHQTYLARPEGVRLGLPRVPGTVQGLKIVADRLSDVRTQIHSDAAATETVFRSASFDDVSVLVFATHALLVGEGEVPEPALVLTPPQSASAMDDGLLTASELALFDLPVDMVLLSGCNTGGSGGRVGATGLSGLASSFFQAGVKSVVASHWNLGDYPTSFIYGAFLLGVSDTSSDRPGDVMRKIIRSAVKSDRERFRHPATWGAFMIIGAG